jgi:hypothetical protein
MGEAMADNDFIHLAAIMEAALPHVDTRTKTTMDLMSKLVSLMGCFQNLKKTNLAACGFVNEKIDVEKLLTAIRPVCIARELAIVDQILSMFQAKRMFEMYKTYMEAMKAMQGFEGSPFGDFTGNEEENHSENSPGFDFSSFLNGFSNNLEGGSASENKEADHQDTSEATEDTSGKNNMLDMLKAMVPPEQMSTFENLSMLFNSMSYDNSNPDHM